MFDIAGFNLIDADLESTHEHKDAKFEAYFDDAGNKVADPVFEANSIKPTADLGMNPLFSDGFCDPVAFKGAIDPSGTPWYAGWSFYDNLVAGNTNSDALTLGTLETWTYRATTTTLSCQGER